jgi:hypothetical protein
MNTPENSINHSTPDNGEKISLGHIDIIIRELEKLIRRLFRIQDAPPEVTGCNPDYWHLGSSTTVEIGGKNLSCVSEVSFSVDQVTPDDKVTPDNETIVALETKVSVYITVASDASLGDRYITVTCEGKKYTPEEKLFAVKPKIPGP